MTKEILLQQFNIFFIDLVFGSLQIFPVLLDVKGLKFLQTLLGSGLQSQNRSKHLVKPVRNTFQFQEFKQRNTICNQLRLVSKQPIPDTPIPDPTSQVRRAEHNPLELIHDAQFFQRNVSSSQRFRSLDLLQF